MFTEHSEASRKETKGLAQQCCKILQRHVEVVGSLGTLSWGSQSNFASSKFDFEILMSLPEDDGRWNSSASHNCCVGNGRCKGVEAGARPSREGLTPKRPVDSAHQHSETIW
jgi:hypothetical protein